MTLDDEQQRRDPGETSRAGGPPEPPENGPEPAPLPRTFAPPEQDEGEAPEVEWKREEEAPPGPPPRDPLRAALNFVRVSLGFRRLPDGVRLDHGLPRLRRLLRADDRRTIRLTVLALAAAAAFAAVALLILSGYGLVARGPTAIETATHRELLLQATDALRAGDAARAHALRDELSAAGRADPSLRFLDGYLLAADGADRSQVVDRLSRRTLRRARRVSNLVTLAGFHEAHGEASAALAALREAGRLAPRDVALQVLVAAALLATGRFDEAAQTATSIEQEYGPNTLTFSIRGAAYLGAGRPELARRDFATGLMYEPDAGRLRLSLAAALTELGEHRKALAELYRVSQYYPENADVYAQLGLLRERTGDYQGAERTYRRAIELNPDHAGALNNLAYLLAERMDSPAAALPFAKRAYELAPRAPPVLDTLGWTWHLLGRSKEALPLLEQAARLAPEDEEIRSHLARVRRALQQPARPPAPAADDDRAQTASPEVSHADRSAQGDQGR